MVFFFLTYQKNKIFSEKGFASYIPLISPGKRNFCPYM